MRWAQCRHIRKSISSSPHHQNSSRWARNVCVQESNWNWTLYLETWNVSTRENSGEVLTTVSTELFRSPLSLLASSKTHLAAANRESTRKCQGFNDYLILAGRNPCRGSKRVRSPEASPPSKTPERLKKNPTGQQVLEQRRGPSLFGWGAGLSLRPTRQRPVRHDPHGPAQIR